ncbi:cellobiose transport system permease protein [Nocardioides luteus]|uniref:Sugar ABC transporter permease n=1 Tax=Nocardioides luteus TaxID=1844 RepID=A0ABQ5SWF8_9ACTN|nr:sugar ABC transporter permease [Nocardioides luteus]MDR7312256.1 cellobiose transport system permease protein [Nocardioides luteus]GGR57055.1 sugar ABC transporter permease [Nocardioides luteus]GLJ68502.1 sugar ABC transporter permease [Nocardioides luteus]
MLRTEEPTSAEGAKQAPSAGAAPSRMEWRDRLSRWDVKFSPYLYVLPFFLVFAVIGLYPMVYTGYLSFFSWPRFGSGHGPFVGLENYAHVLTDATFHKAFWNTFGIFLLSSVPQIMVATVLAALLDTQLKGRSWWRMSILLPFVVAPAAAALIFGAIFADRTGLVNQWLDAVGLPMVPWHADRFASWTAIATMVNWRWTGYNALIVLAAMQAIPRDLYEAADIDGATKIRQFFHITLPSIRPTMIFVIVTSTIGGLQIFTEPRLFDTNLRHQGGSDFQYQTLTMYVFNTAQTATDPYPRAAAAAWILFLIIVGIALVNFLVTRAFQRRSLS